MQSITAGRSPNFPTPHSDAGRTVEITTMHEGVRANFKPDTETITAYKDYTYATMGTVGWDSVAWVDMRALPKGHIKLHASVKPVQTSKAA